MGPIGHEIPNMIGVDQGEVEQRIRKLLPGYMAMGRHGMSEHAGHQAMGMMKGPANTLPMMTGEGPFGPIDMGGMFTVLKVRDDQAPGDYRDPGPYKNPEGTVAYAFNGDADAAPQAPHSSSNRAPAAEFNVTKPGRKSRSTNLH